MLYVSKRRFERVIITEDTREQVEALGMQVNPMTMGNVIVMMEGTNMIYTILGSVEQFDLEYESEEAITQNFQAKSNPQEA